MISNDILTLAVTRGIINAAQAEQLRVLAGVDTPPDDPEKLRFITGFGDIFVAIGIVLFLTALGIFLGGFGMAGTGGALALVSWGLAEFFTRKRRMALPSILLLGAFVGATFFAVLGLMPGKHDGAIFETLAAGSFIVPAVVAAGAAYLHYRRFRLPIAPAAGGAALMVLLAALLFVAIPKTAEILLPYLMVLGGSLFFLLALRLDYSDPNRQTRRTDMAFWLHLLAAPLIVHPVMHWADALESNSRPEVTLALFAVLALVALAADRRAILVSGLVYAGVAISYLSRSGLSTADLSVTFALLLLGALILLLSAGWQALRGLLLRLLPETIRRVLPHPAADGISR